MPAVRIRRRVIKACFARRPDRKVSSLDLFRARRLSERGVWEWPLPIGEDQTISQPYIVAFMTEALSIKKGSKVLEIGTGSGYQAAVLAEMGAEVYSIEIIPDHAERAAAVLRRLGYAAHTRIGDGFDGWKAAAPFDAIIVTAAPGILPSPLIDQLKEGGADWRCPSARKNKPSTCT